MHYRAKLKLKIGGWYRTQEGAVYKIVECPHEVCGGDHCSNQLMVCMYSPKQIIRSTLCGGGSIRAELIYYCTDEEITFHSL